MPIPGHWFRGMYAFHEPNLQVPTVSSLRKHSASGFIVL